MRLLLTLVVLLTGLSGCAMEDYGYDDYRVREDDCWDDHVYRYEYVESYYPPHDEHCEPDGFYADFHD